MQKTTTYWLVKILCAARGRMRLPVSIVGRGMKASPTSSPSGEILWPWRLYIFAPPGSLTPVVCQSRRNSLSIGLKTSLKTNAGGWFNIAADGQRKGWYIAVARKSGFRMAVKLMRYTGKPVDMTIELSSRN